MQYPKPKPTTKNPYTVERKITPIHRSHTHEVHVQQGRCSVVTFHYSREAAENERRFQAHRLGYVAEVVEVRL